VVEAVIPSVASVASVAFMDCGHWFEGWRWRVVEQPKGGPGWSARVPYSGQNRAEQSRGRPAFLHSMMLASRDTNLRCNCEGWRGIGTQKKGLRTHAARFPRFQQALAQAQQRVPGDERRRTTTLTAGWGSPPTGPGLVGG
jgi:hypothetical protein